MDAPNRSPCDPMVLACFIARKVVGDLGEVPGIGPAAIARFTQCTIRIDNGNAEKVVGVTSTFGLFGVYLCFKNGKDEHGNARKVGQEESDQKFYLWLNHVGISVKGRQTVVICMREKVDATFFNPEEGVAKIDDISRLSVRQLKEIIEVRGGSTIGIVEKSELVDLVRALEVTPPIIRLGFDPLDRPKETNGKVAGNSDGTSGDKGIQRYDTTVSIDSLQKVQELFAEGVDGPPPNELNLGHGQSIEFWSTLLICV